MSFAQRLISARFGWVIVLTFSGAIYIGALSFDHFLVIEWESGCGETYPCTTYLDGMDGGATISPLASSTDLGISEKFSEAILFSLAAAAISLALRRIFSGDSISLPKASLIFTVAYTLEAIFLTAYLVWYSLTQHFDTVFVGEWNRSAVLYLALHVGALSCATLAATAFLFPMSSVYSHDS